jgi:predicted dehydrogenase
VTPDKQFVGWDAFKKVVAVSDVNYVILATPPAFRPMHLRAAIEAGKNVFTEKPVAVDTAGIKSVYELADLASPRTSPSPRAPQRRHQAAYIEAMKRVHDGAIRRRRRAPRLLEPGRPLDQAPPARMDRHGVAARNWLYFTWLSGDHIVEQHVHNLDVANWVMGDKIPVRVVGVGGRQARTGPEYGHIYDHFALDYEYENGVHLMSMARQQAGTPVSSPNSPQGSKGRCDTQDGVRYESRGRTRGSGRAADRTVRSGAHGSDRQHPWRHAAQRTAAASPSRR